MSGGVVIVAAAPQDPQVTSSFRAYLTEIVGRWYGRAATEDFRRALVRADAVSAARAPGVDK